MSLIQKMLGAAAAIVVGLSLAVAGGAAPAQAVGASICGSGFYNIDSASVKGDGYTWGTVYLAYNSSKKQNCVYMNKSRYVGSPTWTSAWITVEGGYGSRTDEGFFSYYAATNPIYAPSGRCVRWGGTGSNQDGDNYNAIGGSYVSPWEHCG
ncbi:MAG: hypothetical protein HOQ05_02105 [Corynebacteriales bacterium]|nr:hypothetical protein [Mycobacteriales bacterium]